MTSPMASRIRRYTFDIRSSNHTQYQDLYEEVALHLEPLVRLTLKYPIEVELEDLRYVFEDEGEIRGFVQDLSDALKAYAEPVRRATATQTSHAPA